MSEQELMSPRYRVIADFWDNPFQVGQILQLTKKNNSSSFEYTWAGHDGLYSKLESEFTDYPHLFKKLEWWQDRKLEDLPKYVINKSAIPKVIIPVTWALEEDTHSFKYEKQLFAIYHGKYYPYGLLPATEQQYTDYINSLTK